MILDFRNAGGNEWKHSGSRCTVNGNPVDLVFYVDTDSGLVKSYDVLGDRKVHTVREVGITLPEGAEIDDRGVMFKAVRGVVEIHKSS